MEDEEFVAWLPLLQEEYAEDLARDYGMSADRARARALAEIDGHRPDGHSVFVIEVDGETVGHRWLAERRDAYEPTLSVYDIDVDEPTAAVATARRRWSSPRKRHDGGD